MLALTSRILKMIGQNARHSVFLQPPGSFPPICQRKIPHIPEENLPSRIRAGFGILDALAFGNFCRVFHTLFLTQFA
jgi:hypothetical protein